MGHLFRRGVLGRARNAFQMILHMPASQMKTQFSQPKQISAVVTGTSSWGFESAADARQYGDAAALDVADDGDEVVGLGVGILPQAKVDFWHGRKRAAGCDREKPSAAELLLDYYVTYGAHWRNRTADTAIFSHLVSSSRSIRYVKSILENRPIWINEIGSFWKTSTPSLTRPAAPACQRPRGARSRRPAGCPEQKSFRA